MNLIMHYSNIWVNDHKFIAIVDNVDTLQLSPGPPGPLAVTKICPWPAVFNSISSVPRRRSIRTAAIL